MVKSKKSNLIILIMIVLLLILLIVVSTLLQLLEENEANNVNVSVDTETVLDKKTVKQVIESYDSEYLEEKDKVFKEIYANFKYDLFDQNGNSKKQYFCDMIEDIVKIEKDSFFLKDIGKNIDIYVQYDSNKEICKIIFNNDENYYDNTNGEIYTDLAKTQIVPESNFSIRNTMIRKIVGNYTYYVGTELTSLERVELDNGYYSYRDGAIISKIQSGKALNIVLKEKFNEEIASEVYVTTPLEKVNEKYSNLAFGSVNDGYLGYREDNAYVFLYEDEISIYGYQYKENEYFDEYLWDYCQTGNLDKLYKDFTTEWTNYFEKEYNPEMQSLKITFPTRGIEIDIKDNDSTGITIYSNYYLTDKVKELIKANKITLEADKDLIHITEKARRESSR